MIPDPYLLVITIPCYLDTQGRRFVEELWHKDLLKHLDHIANLTLASPTHLEPPPPGRYLPIDPSPTAGSITFVDLPPCRSTFYSILTLPKAVSRLWKAVGAADVVHANVAGWPVPYGWLAAPIAKLRGKFLLTNIESAAWRTNWRKPFSPKRLILGSLFEGMARLCVNLSDLATFTQPGYRDELLLKRRSARGHVVSASWIDEADILRPEQAEAVWAAKLIDPDRPLRLAYAGQLNESKGVAVLLSALEDLARRGTRAHVQIYGNGAMLGASQELANRLHGNVSMELCGTLPYGPEFFAKLGEQDLLIVPSLSDEQPRIVFDAFSQAVPVIASDTAGLRQCVTDGQNGWLVSPGDPSALAVAVVRAAGDRQALRLLGIKALDTARALTHDAMHLQRAELLKSALERSRGKPALTVAPSETTISSEPNDSTPLLRRDTL